MKECTHREYRLWMEFFASEWNEPSRTDHYIMQVAAQVRLSNAKEGTEVSLDEFKIPFNVKREEPKKPKPEADSEAWSKKMIDGFVAAFGKKGVTFRKKLPDGTIIEEVKTDGKRSRT